MRNVGRLVGRLLLVGLVVGCTSNLVVSPPPSAVGTDQAVDQDGFPLMVGQLPVVEIGGLNTLRANGGLNGRAAAVKGYWIRSLIPSCPAPPHFLSSLEEWCRFEVFSDTPYMGV